MGITVGQICSGQEVLRDGDPLLANLVGHRQPIRSRATPANCCHNDCCISVNSDADGINGSPALDRDSGLYALARNCATADRKRGKAT